MAQFVLPKEGERFNALWPVTVSQPVDGGGLASLTLKPRFALIDEDALKAHRDAAITAITGESGEEVDAAEWKRFGAQGVIIAAGEAFALTFLQDVITDIEELPQEGRDGFVPFSSGVLKVLVKNPYVRKALILGYFNFHAGIEEKNSETPST